MLWLYPVVGSSFRDAKWQIFCTTCVVDTRSMKYNGTSSKTKPSEKRVVEWCVCLSGSSEEAFHEEGVDDREREVPLTSECATVAVCMLGTDVCLLLCAGGSLHAQDLHTFQDPRAPSRHGGAL